MKFVEGLSDLVLSYIVLEFKPRDIIEAWKKQYPKHAFLITKRKTKRYLSKLLKWNRKQREKGLIR